MNLSKQTQKVMKAVESLVKNHDYPPTLREIAAKSGLSSTWTVRHHLKKLKDAGLIKIKNNISRGIEIMTHTSGIPLVGIISAGKPIDAIENIDGYMGDFPGFFGSKDVFALRIKGDSMKEDGIFDGDIVIIKKQASASDGDIVAAMYNDEATVKRYKFTKKGIKLIPANPKYSPVTSKEITVLGRVTGVIRKYR